MQLRNMFQPNNNPVPSIEEVERIINTPRQMLRITSQKGDCPVCGRTHNLTSQSDRCYYCSQKLIIPVV